MAAASLTTSQYNLLPGRLRISIKSLLQSPAFAHYIATRLVKEKYIYSVTANPLTGRALIHFNPTYICLTEIQSLIFAIEQRYSIQKSTMHESVKMGYNHPPELIKSPGTYALATGLILVGLITKRFFAGKSPLSSSPQIFSFAALATLIAGYPLLRNRFETVAKKHNMNYELLLFLPTLLLLTIRESITGLSVLWLVQLTYWLGTAAQENSHKSISNLLMRKQLQALKSPSEEKENLNIKDTEVKNNISTHKNEEKKSSSSLLAEKIIWYSLAISGISFLLTRNFMRSLAILLAGCPAAISLSKDAAMHSAVRQAAEKGVFIKQVEALERLGDVDTVLFEHESYTGIDQLHSLGIKDIRVITSDPTANWHSMLPDDKEKIIKDMQTLGKKIVMIGDGTNDSPAFAASDVAIAMGRKGTAQAIETADIVIANDDPRKVAEIIYLSRYMNKVIRQNVSFATVFNIAGVALAATSLITPITAGLLLNISTLAIIMNSKCSLSGKKPF
ncbi:MAG: ATPase-associated domain protein [Firmicutes bacterium]|nr:ATPase-associated domain protein [Bacillota bacterium]